MEDNIVAVMNSSIIKKASKRYIPYFFWFYFMILFLLFTCDVTEYSKKIVNIKLFLKEKNNKNSFLLLAEKSNNWRASQLLYTSICYPKVKGIWAPSLPFQ